MSKDHLNHWNMILNHIPSGFKSCCAAHFLSSVSVISSWFVTGHKSGSTFTVQNHSSCLLEYSVCVIILPKRVMRAHMCMYEIIIIIMIC